MIERLEEKIKEGQERWAEIESEAEILKRQTEGTGPDVDIDAVAELLLLVIDHLRPMNPSQEQMEQMTNRLTTILKGIGK